MKLESYSTVHDFYRAALPFLMKREAASGLIQSSCMKQLEKKTSRHNPPFLCMVKEENKTQLVAYMAPPDPLLLFGEKEGVESVVQKLIDEDWGIARLSAPAALAEAFAKEWEHQTGNTHRVISRIKLYRTNDISFPSISDGNLRQGNLQDVDQAGSWLYEMGIENRSLLTENEALVTAKEMIEENSIYFWENERPEPVSMAALTRQTPNHATIHMVHTPKEYRRKGYAKACVANLSKCLLETGAAYCTLYADAANAAANKLYISIGYQEIEEYTEMSFSQK
ncbi:GNAT family N-acetyltransferase [Fictibacillus fluitans]|uniref:GNAT family N-acetyltransferase n=1 Tax=Fictibacillus fluitans TaxID=3058422 RepID=A0ABT8HVC7_9BACL|nr:GNAT family N-acetyltransferase [Fictibacillus sp. NE201]MDN4524693.1 GNAT family N-acetyltransferase [Fictibacillus sp. NE201]